ncbi:MAG: hypothetical protein ACLP0J_04820 [Solirubrobacteraceae bacterium]
MLLLAVAPVMVDPVVVAEFDRVPLGVVEHVDGLPLDQNPPMAKIRRRRGAEQFPALRPDVEHVLDPLARPTRSSAQHL